MASRAVHLEWRFHAFAQGHHPNRCTYPARRRQTRDPNGGGRALPTVFREPSARKHKQKAQDPKAQPRPRDQNGGILGTAKQTLKQKVDSEISARTYGVSDIVRAPNRKEKLVDFLWARLPYHPQYLSRGARVDSPLIDPLQFGTVAIKTASLAALGAQPTADAIGRVRLLTPLDSTTAKVGDSVRASVSIPLFTPDHRLVVPEGTVLAGTVTVARKARSFHRSGQLRFRFSTLTLPEEASSPSPLLLAGSDSAASAKSQDEMQRELMRRPAPTIQTQATLQGAEANSAIPIKVDSEGGVEAPESKTRFLAPAIALVIASKAADADAGRNHATQAGSEANVPGRTLGGLSGFGLVGMAASQGSKYVGMGFGYYGLAPVRLFKHRRKRRGDRFQPQCDDGRAFRRTTGDQVTRGISAGSYLPRECDLSVDDVQLHREHAPE
jgi:hypothetical protein